jgi:hypothetical protein
MPSAHSMRSLQMQTTYGTWNAALLAATGPERNIGG